MLAVGSTHFPGGVEVEQPGFDNLCGTCHSGRASKATVDAQIATGQLRFVNVHYLPAAGTKLGAAAAVGYEYPDKMYAGALTHTGGAQCTSCHDPVASQHSFTIEDTWAARCSVCHADANGDPEKVRLRHLADYDGDGDVNESLRSEIDGMAALLAAMQTVPGQRRPATTRRRTPTSSPTRAATECAPRRRPARPMPSRPGLPN